MRQSTIADYNSKDRALEFCVDIYFNGASQAPLHCTRADYLIDCDVLDEACSDTDTFIGAPSANEASFQLFGSSGLFNPGKSTGPYYGKIKTGVMVKVYCRPIESDSDDIARHGELAAYTHGVLANYTHEEVHHMGNVDEPFAWDPLGVFYVTDWQTDITGVTANVTCCDKLYSLFNTDVTKLKVMPNYSYENLIKDFFRTFGIVPAIIGDLSELLTFAYIDGTNADFIKKFAIGALAFIFCDHLGNVVVQDIDRISPVDFTLTDNDQILSVKSKQSAILEYDGVSLVYNRMQISDEVELLTARGQDIPAATTRSFTSQGLSKSPMYAIGHCEISSDANCFVKAISGTPVDVSYDIKNLVNLDTTFNITVFGYIIEAVKILLEDTGSNLLSIDNVYVQNEAYAQRLKALLMKYITLRIPMLDLEVRGNPLIPIGSKLHIVSEMYDIDFTGVLVRQQYKYDGGLSATMSILSSEIVGG